MFSSQPFIIRLDCRGIFIYIVRSDGAIKMAFPLFFLLFDVDVVRENIFVVCSMSGSGSHKVISFLASAARGKKGNIVNHPLIESKRDALPLVTALSAMLQNDTWNELLTRTIKRKRGGVGERLLLKWRRVVAKADATMTAKCFREIYGNMLQVSSNSRTKWLANSILDCGNAPAEA